MTDWVNVVCWGVRSEVNADSPSGEEGGLVVDTVPWAVGSGQAGSGTLGDLDFTCLAVRAKRVHKTAGYIHRGKTCNDACCAPEVPALQIIGGWYFGEPSLRLSLSFSALGTHCWPLPEKRYGLSRPLA